jgi:predicted enzyme related to lactoylglutathione lyase
MGSLSYVSLVSPEYESLADFYVETVGLSEHVAWRHEGFRALDGGNGVVIGFHSPDSVREIGVALPVGGRLATMLTFDPGDVATLDTLTREFAAAGVTVLREPFDTPYGSRQAVFADPEGNPFRLNTFR